MAKEQRGLIRHAFISQVHIAGDCDGDGGGFKGWLSSIDYAGHMAGAQTRLIYAVVNGWAEYCIENYMAAILI